ncbi:hypothetical protein FB451DRAFT_1570061 [Mycena latifolia]|nr:hypothetical protein FB451DRAFT_1570061 [Mycena latifolia]
MSHSRQCQDPRSRSLFINQQGDRRPQELTLDHIRKWGDDTELIFARAKCGDASKRFCLRMLLNAELLKDAKFHSTHLADIKGSFVRLYYGMWVMNTGEWAGKVLFSLTQWCGISWRELAFTRLNTQADRILVGRAFEALHDHGIDHRGIRNVRDFRHALVDDHAPGLTQADLLNGKAPLPEGATPASAALEWHVKYSELYPDESNACVLIAQRARLYPEMPPLYHNIEVSIENMPLVEGDGVGGFSADSVGPETVSDSLETIVDKLQFSKLDDPVRAC